MGYASEQSSSYKFVGDRLWLKLNTNWGGVNGDNSSCKRFPFWESESQLITEDAWIVFKPVTEAEWNAAGFGGGTDCEGSLAVCE